MRGLIKISSHDYRAALLNVRLYFLNKSTDGFIPERLSVCFQDFFFIRYRLIHFLPGSTIISTWHIALIMPVVQMTRIERYGLAFDCCNHFHHSTTFVTRYDAAFGPTVRLEFTQNTDCQIKRFTIVMFSSLLQLFDHMRDKLFSVSDFAQKNDIRIHLIQYINNALISVGYFSTSMPQV